MSKQKSVALLIETSNSYARGLLRGIASYIHEGANWSVYLPEQERGARPPDWIGDWSGDGIIARIENDEIAAAIRPLKIPVVDVSAARCLPRIPYVETDDEAISKLAYEHLRERGFECFAFCGDYQFVWSNNRQQAFIRTAAADGYGCSVFAQKPKSSASLDSERRRLSKWLMGLPKPVGLFASYDKKALEVLDVCRQLNIQVPIEVAVLGMDNDEVLCDLCTPPLSSIIPAAEQTGRQAAAMLDRMMTRRKSKANANTESILVPPVGIATRQSTDIVAIDDPDIATAVRFIRDHCCESINVQDLLKLVPLSRRVLEGRFQTALGRTPHQEIVRRRIDRVRFLLLTSDLSLAQIARQTGFQNQEYMNVAFRRSVGVPPGQFRRDQRAGANQATKA